jgi:hypothetical protein
VPDRRHYFCLHFSSAGRDCFDHRVAYTEQANLDVRIEVGE